MNLNDFKELLENRASHRKYLTDPIPQEDIIRMMDAARLAPSGHNLQPYKFAAISDKKIIEKIADAVSKNYHSILDKLPVDLLDELQKYEFFIQHFKEAPMIIIVFTQKAEYTTSEIESKYGVKLPETKLFDIQTIAVGAVIQNFLLAARTLGYGTCWLTEPIAYAQQKIEEILNIVEPWHAVSVISITKLAKERKCAPKKAVEDLLTFISF